MKKVLIYMNQYELSPSGGPGGYCYNLMSEMNGREEFGNIKIEFIKENHLVRRWLRNAMPKSLRQVRLKKNAYNIVRRALDGTDCNALVDINQYDAVHFHDTFSLYFAKDSLVEYKGKVILMSHSPKALHKEYIEEKLSKEDVKKNFDELKEFGIVDEYAFNRADYIIYPCKEAEEPYYHSWNKYEEIHNNNAAKYKYIVTGIKQCYPRLSREEFRKQNNIDKDAFVVCYVGRHNETKGYDIFKSAMKTVLNSEGGQNTYVVCAGSPQPISGYKHERWTEVGWTDDAYSIINAADLFVLPNRETYFDLILLEVLSIGTPVLASYTGGNKYFEEFQGNGIWLYEDYENSNCLAEMVIEYRDKRVDNEIVYKMKNKKLFQDRFSSKRLLENYVKLMDSILNN